MGILGACWRAKAALKGAKGALSANYGSPTGGPEASSGKREALENQLRSVLGPAQDALQAAILSSSAALVFS